LNPKERLPLSDIFVIGGASQWSIGWAGEDSGVVNQNKNQRKPPI
jgi:hypothetical protein